ncbi:MAG: hypothetical protein IKP54_11135 [Bacteroidales bacterium]|nr:hypothetical protein [Bacteroidales bacterium]
MMAEQPDHLNIGDFDLVRGQADSTYEGIYGVAYAQHEFGTLLFDRFSDKEKKYCWLSIRNQVFYSDMMSIALLNEFQDAVGFECINNITQLELACDLSFNPVPRIKKLLKREDVAVVRCGAKIEDKKQVIDGLFFLHPTSGLKELAPTMYFSDTDKRKSFVVYDKKKEIQRSNKAYIADYYGNPRRLYRMEIRLTSDELFRYFQKYDISPSVDLLVDQSFLKSMYDEFLFRLFHFSYRRKSIGLLDAVLAMKEGYDIDVKMFP